MEGAAEAYLDVCFSQFKDQPARESAPLADVHVSRAETVTSTSSAE